MGNNIIAHLIFFSHLSYTYTFISHPFENLLHPHGLFKLSNNNSELSFFLILLFAKFSLPSSIFSPSLCLSHQYGYVQVQLCKSSKQRLKRTYQIIVNLLYLGSFLNTKTGDLMLLGSLLVS